MQEAPRVRLRCFNPLQDLAELLGVVVPIPLCLHQLLLQDLCTGRHRAAWGPGSKAQGSKAPRGESSTVPVAASMRCTA